MNITYTQNIKECTFNEIEHGECFELNGYYYMKIRAVDDKDTNRYIVSLLNGNMLIQNAPCKVTPVKAECNILYE